MLVFVLLTGCAEYAAKDGAFAPSEVSHDGSTTLDSAQDGNPPEPAWFAVRASLDVDEAGPKAGAGTVQLEVVDADQATSLCTVDLKLSDLAAAPQDDAEVALWWEMTVQPVGSPCATLPERLGLGLGALGPDVIARLGSVGLDQHSDTLYGAYVQVDRGDLVSFGYAGTAGNVDGTAAAEFPPAPGRYQLAPLYLLALPPQGD